MGDKKRVQPGSLSIGISELACGAVLETAGHWGPGMMLWTLLPGGVEATSDPEACAGMCREPGGQKYDGDPRAPGVSPSFACGGVVSIPGTASSPKNSWAWLQNRTRIERVLD